MDIKILYAVCQTDFCGVTSQVSAFDFTTFVSEVFCGINIDKQRDICISRATFAAEKVQILKKKVPIIFWETLMEIILSLL